MSVFKPTLMIEKITDITPAMLSSMGVEALLLDVDNTLASYKHHEPIEGAVEWTKAMTAAGFKLIVVSNNYASRVAPFSGKFDLPYITFAMKPLPFGYIKARKSLSLPHKKCAIIGDQIFTDIVGANLCGMKSILLTPVEMEKGLLIQARRVMEKGLRKRYAEETLPKE